MPAKNFSLFSFHSTLANAFLQPFFLDSLITLKTQLVSVTAKPDRSVVLWFKYFLV